jgi:hypothetical protein
MCRGWLHLRTIGMLTGSGDPLATADIKGTQNVSGGRVSIAVVMKLTAIIALNLAILRAAPSMLLLAAPVFLFVVIVLDLALVQAVTFGRPLRAFYFTFLFVGIFWTGVITVLVLRQSNTIAGSLRILETAIEHYRAVQGRSRVISPYVDFPMLLTAERWVTGTLGLLPPLAAP